MPTKHIQKRFRFSPKQRLQSKKDYDTVFLDNISAVENCFRLIARKNTLNHARLGLRIGKKNIKRAFRRNLIKRLVRESFRLHQHDLKNQDIVIILRRKMQNRDRKAIHETLEKLWQKI